MRIIDVHTHAFPDHLAPRATARLADHGGVTPSYDGTVAGLVGAMDRADVAVSVMLPVATKPSQVSVINDWAAGLRAPGSPWIGRILPFGTMHPDFEDPGAEIARMAELGLTGIKMHPDYQSYVPNEARLEPIYRAAREHGLWMLLHAGGDIVPQTYLGTPETYAEVLETWPGLRVILAHMGGWRLWEAAAEHIIGRDVVLDTAYTPGHLPDEEFVGLVRRHGVDRVVFGSDGPFADPGAEIGNLRTTGLTDDELASVLGGNASRLLGLQDT
jgi:predicted TIM-barrel fold metal-dependent hydrolase